MSPVNQADAPAEASAVEPPDELEPPVPHLTAMMMTSTATTMPMTLRAVCFFFGGCGGCCCG